MDVSVYVDVSVVCVSLRTFLSACVSHILSVYNVFVSALPILSLPFCLSICLLLSVCFLLLSISSALLVSVPLCVCVSLCSSVCLSVSLWMRSHLYAYLKSLHVCSFLPVSLSTSLFVPLPNLRLIVCLSACLYVYLAVSLS